MKKYESYEVEGRVIIYDNTVFVIEMDNDQNDVPTTHLFYFYVCPLNSKKYAPLGGIEANSENHAFEEYLLQYGDEA